MSHYRIDDLKHPQFYSGGVFHNTETFINRFCICPMVPYVIKKFNIDTGWKTSGLIIRFTFFILKVRIIDVKESFVDTIAIKTFPVYNPVHFSPLGILVPQPAAQDFHTTMQTMEYRMIGNALIYYPKMPANWYRFFKRIDFVFQGNPRTVLNLMIFRNAYFCIYEKGFFVVLHYCSFEDLPKLTEEKCRNLLVNTFSSFGYNTKMSYYCEKYRCFKREDTTDLATTDWNVESWCDPLEIEVKERVTRHK